MTDIEKSDREVVIRKLSRQRPRSRFVRWSTLLLVGLAIYSWLAGDFRFTDLTAPHRLQNLKRFIGELSPYPLQNREWDWTVARRWTADLMEKKGWAAAKATLAISVAAITLAGLGGLLLSFAATRTFANPEPYLPQPIRPSLSKRLCWSFVVAATRAILIFLRAIPEYVWAFLLISMFGPTAWPAVLALALHNLGILGKLNADVVENLDDASLQSLRGVGASRSQIAFAGILPTIVPRFLLFFFYRWETCVREATVLGMLGIISLGYFIQDARARNHYDDMFMLILVGSAIVMIGDLVSAAARHAVREKS